MNDQDYKSIQEKAIKQFKEGKSLLGKDGAFAPLLQQFLEAALEAEMSEHLSESKPQKKNKRNGKGKKTLKTNHGPVEIKTPQDRNSTFEPQIVKKRERVLLDSLSNKIIALYGKGMSLRDISEYIEEMYGMNVSAATLSQITDKVIPDIQQWQNRPLDPVYPIVFMDAMHFKVKDNGRIQSKAIYTVLGINKTGRKEILGLYFSESEGANFWLSVLTELQNRGVEEILIAAIDNLKGFAEAINSVYPLCEVQTCIIHQIRNSIKYVASKEQKAFMSDLKLVYKADTKVTAELELENLAKKWGKRYPVVINSWQNNWEKLSTYFQYSPYIRKIIYTTNTVEGYHRQVRKVTKTKGAFTSETALMKLAYLATQEISKKWTQPMQNWGLIIQQLAIHFGSDRLRLDI